MQLYRNIMKREILTDITTACCFSTHRKLVMPPKNFQKEQGTQTCPQTCPNHFKPAGLIKSDKK